MASFVKKHLFLVVFVCLIVLAALAVAGYFAYKYQKTQQLLQNPTLAAKEQTQDILNKVGKLIELPTDESPQIATVSDISKLAGQPFFAKAKNGDKVLIYTQNKLAILYDPTANIVVTVAPVNIAQPTPTPTPVSTIRHKTAPTPTPKK